VPAQSSAPKWRRNFGLIINQISHSTEFTRSALQDTADMGARSMANQQHSHTF
jgi:hypothetical protein